MCHHAHSLRKFLYNFILHYCTSVIIKQEGGTLCKYHKIHVTCLSDNKTVSEISSSTCISSLKRNDIETYHWPNYITRPNPPTPEKTNLDGGLLTDVFHCLHLPICSSVPPILSQTHNHLN